MAPPLKISIDVRVPAGPSPTLSTTISDCSGNRVESFSGLLRQPPTSRTDQSLAHQCGNGAKPQSRQDRPHASSKINQTSTSDRGSSHKLPHSTVWGPFLPPQVTGAASSSHIIRAHPCEIQQPQTADTSSNTTSIGIFLTVNQLGRQESLPQVGAYHLSQRSSHIFGQEHGNSVGMF